MDSDSEDDLPPGWEERATVDGNVYYVNHISKTTQWIHPRSGRKKYTSRELPCGWNKLVEPDGKVLFRHEVTNVSTPSDPRLAFSYEVENSPNDVRYRFDGSSKALDTLHGLDLSDRVALITGACSGIGFETALSLALHGCQVVLACRCLDAANTSIQIIKSKRQNAKCVALKLDLSSLSSVEQFVEELKGLFRQLDILILNAAIFGLPYTTTVDGYETTFQVCHLGHFYLTSLLKPMIMESMFPRVVVVSSESHRYSNITRANICEMTLSPSVDRYASLIAYNNAKLCNILFANELHKRWYANGVNVYSLHPGNLVCTNLARHWFLIRILMYFCRPFTKSLQQAASTSVFCATWPALISVSGLYFNNCCPCTPSVSAMDEKLSKELWILSEKLIKKSRQSSRRWASS